MDILSHTDISYEALYTGILRNGIKFFIYPKKDYVDSQAMLCVNFGSKDNKYKILGKGVELPDGTAHFLEHKMFEGSGENIFEKFASVGGSANAFTNFSSTAFYFKVRHNFYGNLEILFSMMKRPHLTDENIAKERKIIDQEINMYLDNPSWVLMLNMLSAMYFENPIKLNITGSHESISKISKDKLYNVFENFYTTDNMALIVVGDINPKEVIDFANTKISSLSNSSTKKISSDEPKNVVNNSVFVKMPVYMESFSIGFKDSYLEDDIVKRIAVAKIAGELLFGESSVFYKELYNNGDIDGSISQEYMAGIDFGVLVFGGSSQNSEKVCHLMLDEVQKFLNSGYAEQHLSVRFEQIKKKFLGNIIRTFNSIDAITYIQADLYTKGTNIFSLYDSTKAVTLDETLAKISNLIRYENSVLSVATPQ